MFPISLIYSYSIIKDSLLTADYVGHSRIYVISNGKKSRSKTGSMKQF